MTDSKEKAKEKTFFGVLGIDTDIIGLPLTPEICEQINALIDRLGAALDAEGGATPMTSGMALAVYVADWVVEAPFRGTKQALLVAMFMQMVLRMVAAMTAITDADAKVMTGEEVSEIVKGMFGDDMEGGSVH